MIGAAAAADAQALGGDGREAPFAGLDGLGGDNNDTTLGRRQLNDEFDDDEEKDGVHDATPDDGDGAPAADAAAVDGDLEHGEG